ncbi:LodA/GoxA family CTQ-dependent oxidase [Pseudomonas sp. Marseille-Q5299]|uniref:LodA/GoxA family CTQ-dependent oxidase n=1 Tax=unclassified Pseudomonas TaxID=196821 RepID=UPI000FC11B62|nr:LodA/GoxA family CTQ-dependent oxidase [Pseudomonas sp. Marseille-Q5299]
MTDTYHAAALDSIVRAAIHPAIGIARLGNSQRPDGYFIGPETTGPTAIDAQSMRDQNGAIKRQAARFRVYGYNAAGEVVAELTAENATIKWNVHLANRKAQWYAFVLALDVPAARDLQVPLRNPQVLGEQREQLAIDPGPRSISGFEQQGEQYHFDSGRFLGTPVPLGELRTDEAGRLLVLGGFGSSGSPQGTPIFDPANPSTFANAPGWHDDTADGPVTATVSINGSELQVEGAWVVCAQPNYSPNTLSWRTMYDLLFDTYVQYGWLQAPEQVSFRKHVLPVLLRMSGLQWVNKGFAAMFGSGGPFDFNDPALLGKLAAVPDSETQDAYGQLRRTVYNAFRASDNPVYDPRTWPWIYGDTFGEEVPSPTDMLSASGVRDQVLARWVAGDFVDDWDRKLPSHLPFDKVKVSEQPAMLDQAALDHCVADAFHPGIEMSWPMRNLSLYSAPWRIKHDDGEAGEPDYGPHLSQAQVLSPTGPLNGQRPGGISRWMALPWQVDAAGCRSGYDHQYDPYLPTFWPARVPNQVLTEEDYRIAIDSSQPREERLAAFNRRAHWDRNLAGDTFADKAQCMAEHFGDIGIVGERPGVLDDPELPALMQVETRNAALTRTPRLRAAVSTGNPALDRSLREAGWESLEHYRQALSRFRH